MDDIVNKSKRDSDETRGANPLVIIIDWCKKYIVYIFIFSILIVCGIYSYVTTKPIYKEGNEGLNKKHVRFSETNQYKYI
jgi:hypothetical protein